MARSAVCGWCISYGDAALAQPGTLVFDAEAVYNFCGGDRGELRLELRPYPNRATGEDLDLTDSAKTQEGHIIAERSSSVADPGAVRRQRPTSDRDEQRTEQSRETYLELDATTSSVLIESINPAAMLPKQSIHPSEEEASTSRTNDDHLPQSQQVSPKDKRRIEKFQKRWDANFTNDGDFDRMLRNGADPIMAYLTSQDQPRVLDPEGKGGTPGSRRKEMSVTPMKPAQMKHAGGWATPRHKATAEIGKAVERGRLPRINAGTATERGKLPRIYGVTAIGSGKLPRISKGKAFGRGKISLSQRSGGEEGASVWTVEVSEDEE